MPRRIHAFTLIELLVVVGIIALLLALMLPSLNRARQRANTVRCLANLGGIGKGLVVYQNQNDGFVVPSYNMPRTPSWQANANDVVDGWPAILDRDSVVPGCDSQKNNIFYCPNTFDIDGMAGGQTLYDQDKPSGYQDWPILFTAAGGDSATKSTPSLPIPGFGDGNGDYQHLIRCGYFLNANNPIGTNPASTSVPPTCQYYTQCVGYGPYGNGASLTPVRTASIARPAALIVACDGMYMGRQSVTRLGEQNRRIAYRHLGPTLTVNVNGTPTTFDKTLSNAVFADGHAESIFNNDMPHSSILSENNGSYSLLAAQ